MYEESTVTEKLTGVIKESSITEILEKVKSDMCDKYCKYPEIVKNQGAISKINYQETGALAPVLVGS